MNYVEKLIVRILSFVAFLIVVLVSSCVIAPIIWVLFGNKGADSFMENHIEPKLNYLLEKMD